MKQTIIDLFQVPEAFSLLEVATRLKRILQYKIEIIPLTQFETLQKQEMIEFLSQISSAEVPKRTREELHNHLKSAPFVVTLLLLDEPDGDLYGENLLNQQYAMLTHMYGVRGLHDYVAFLQFFRSFIENAEPILPLYQLINLTTREVHQKLVSAATQRPDLSRVAPFFLQMKCSRASIKSLLATENQHVQVIDDGIDYVETSDVAGEESSSVLRIASELSLTTAQQRRQFRFKIAGAQRAFYSYESGTPFGMQAALPAEIKEFLEHCAPGLLRNRTTVIAPNDVSYWLIFMFQLFGVPSPLAFFLNNLRSTRPFSKSQNCISYTYDRRGLFINAELNLRADLLSTLAPENADRRLHFVASDMLTLQLPSNILELLNEALRAIDSGSRHGVTLQKALFIDEADYRRWLKTKLKATSLPQRGIGIAALHRSFLQFSKHTVAETYRAFLAQKTTVQSHYVSAEPHQISSTILRSWRDFSEQSGMRWSYVDAHETAKDSVTTEPHREVGSKITLRTELITALYRALLTHHDLNAIAFYIYLRVASTSALRPVREPFPEIRHLDLDDGYMTVADKRVHSADERRLVVMTSSACLLLAAWSKAAALHSHQNLIAAPTHVLMWLDEHGRSWQHFDSKTVNELLRQRTNQVIKSHTFRHVAAKRFLQSTAHFDQRLLNLLMNHSRAGVGLLDRFSALSPALGANLLRRELERYDIEFAELDSAALTHLEAMA